MAKVFKAGVKRHHFKTQDATHGNSLSHRALGSTGQCQDPGRVFKGKKMPGQLGNVKNTIQNLVIVKIIEEDNVILVKGSIPGHDGAKVVIKHTKKKYTLKKILSEEAQPEDKTNENTVTDNNQTDSKTISAEGQSSEKETPKEPAPKEEASSEENKS